MKLNAMKAAGNAAVMSQLTVLPQPGRRVHIRANPTGNITIRARTVTHVGRYQGSPRRPGNPARGGGGAVAGLPGTCVGVWKSMVRSPPETQFVDADPQHLGEPPQIARARTLFAPLPSDGGSRGYFAPKGQGLLGQKQPLTKLADSVPRHLYDSVPYMNSYVRERMILGSAL
jgi:hypothetical protein